jgi:hypothetical protein
MFDGAECATHFDWGWGLVGLEQWTEESSPDFGVENSDADAFSGQGVGIRSWCSFDESMESKAAQVITHLRRGVITPEESGDMPAKAFVREAGDGVDDETECTGQGHGALIPEAQGPGSLALPYVGLVDALKERRADGTALAGTFNAKQTVVDPAGAFDQLGQMLDSGQDAQVSGFINDGLDAQSPPFFQILLDAAVLVGEVHLHLCPRSEHSGLGRQQGTSTAFGGNEHRSDLFGAPDTDVVGDEGLEEASGPAWVVEDQSARHLDLAHGKVEEISCLSVGLSEGSGDDSRPTVEESLNVAWAQAFTDGLEPGRISTGGKAIR